jgi:selenocysteine-specific elongation factor
VVELEIRDLVRGTFLEHAPIIRTSAQSGKGIEELKSAIREACAAVDRATPRGASASPAGSAQPQPAGLADSPRGVAAWFRMPIDRSFIVQGHGTVVTGSVLSGSLKVGDEVEWQPRGERVRVRSLQNHDRPVDEVHRGMRAAINLAGVHHENVVRGQELATPGYLQPSKVVTVRLHCLADAKRAIKHRSPVRFHVGTAEIMGTVSLLDCDTVQPGEWGLAQLFLDDPATTTWGQPFVVRGPSATQTLGGGQVLQPVAKKVRRRHLDVLERIEKLWTGDPEQRALTVAWFGGYSGFTHADLVRGANLAPAEAQAMLERLRAEKKLIAVAAGPNREVLLHVDTVRELDDRILAVLGKLHEENPLMTSHDRQKVQSLLDYVGDDALVHAEVDRLLKTKGLVGDLRRIARADFKPKLSANLRKLKDKVVAAFQEAGFQPPEPASFANQAGGNAASLKDLFDVCVAEGFLVNLGGDVYLHASVEAEMRRRVSDRLTAGTGATVAEIRDLLGTTRKYAVPFCEYLDRVGVTRRDGDLRFAAEARPSVV